METHCTCLSQAVAAQRLCQSADLLSLLNLVHPSSLRNEACSGMLAKMQSLDVVPNLINYCV